MKNRVWTSLLFTTLLLLFVTLLLVTASHYPQDVRIAPFVIGFPTWSLVFILWLGELIPGWRLFGKKRPGANRDAEKQEDTEFTPWGPVFNVLAWIFIFYLFIFLFGLIMVTPVFLTIFLIRKGGVRWRFAVPSAILSTLIFCGFIQGLFKISLWLGAVPRLIPGILGGSIIPPL